MSMTGIAGIDLGTSNSVIAVIDPQTGVPVVVLNEENEPTTPSVVGETSDGKLLIGKPALDHSNTVIRTFKRFMGSADRLRLGDRTFLPEELSAMVLRKLVDDASKRLNVNIERVVISVPAHFGIPERSATIRAGQLAGLTVMHTINEPTAAAIMYIHKQKIKPGYLMILDLGGGTFDITILEINEENTPVVKRTGGALYLGGQNTTDELARWLIDRYTEQNSADITDEVREKLNKLAEQMKLSLTEHQNAQADISSPNGHAIPVTVSLSDFEMMNVVHFQLLKILVDTTLKDAKLKPSDINRVLLVGGATRMPRVRKMAVEIFGFEPDTSLDPDLSVAFGAALVAADIEARFTATQSAEFTEIVAHNDLIKDSATHDYGVKVRQPEMQSYLFDPVIPNGYPQGKWSERLSYGVGRANTLVKVEVFQGDNVTDITKCIYIGSFNVPVPMGCDVETTRVWVWMRLNQSGMLEVQAAVNDEQPHFIEFDLKGKGKNDAD